MVKYPQTMRTVLFFKATEKVASRMKFAGATRAAHDLGLRIQAVDAAENRRDSILKLIGFWQPAGVVIDGSLLDESGALDTPSDLPTVYISYRPRRGRPIFSVCGETEGIVRAAAQELLALDYPQYAFVGYPKDLDWSRVRGRLFRKLIRLHGRRAHAFEESETDTTTYDARLLSWLRSLPKPCGVFAANDFIANRVLNLCAAAGLRVPDDIAVVGVDDDETICCNALPPLTSILPDMERIGYTAVRLLGEIFRDPKMRPVMRETGGSLLVARRASSRARIAYPDDVARALELIRAKACDGLRARDVIAALHGSRRYAELNFREATGHTILDEIQAVRMERARELLSDPTRTVSAIANLCGYASVSAFIKQYGRAYGVRPRRTLTKRRA